MRSIGQLEEKGDAHALLNIKHVFVVTLRLQGRGRALFFLAVTVQVQHINIVKVHHQLRPHPAKGGVVQPAVVGDESHNAVAGTLDAVVRKADEFDVVVIEPLAVALFERAAFGLGLVGLQQLHDPVALVA